MKIITIATLTTALALLTGCSDDDSTNNSLPPGDATYSMTFVALWSADTHPDGFPGNPHFSPLVGGTHNSSLSLWEEGGLATPGIKSMAERGRTPTLEAEVETAIDAGTAEHVLLGGGIGRSPGSVSLNFTVSEAFPRVTLVSMVAPSPDWFVGVSGLNLWQNGAWVDSLTVDLFLNDAGTDNGADYTSANDPADPPVSIMPITGYPALVADEIPPIGTFTFTRQ